MIITSPEPFPYYCLNAHCRLVTGAARAAIYDLAGGKVYSVNGAAAALLKTCAAAPAAQALSSDDADFLQNLTHKGLGGFRLQPQPVPAAFLPSHQLDFLWLELTSACNCRCLHCYGSCGPQENAPPLPLTRWLSLLQEARDCGAAAVQLIGGEPLLYKGWEEIVRQAAGLGYEMIEIFTNATLLDDEVLRICQHYHVSIATTIYAACAEVHDRITGCAGSFGRTMAAIDRIRAAGLPLRVASVIMKDNEHEVDNIMKLYQALGLPDSQPDAVRPSGRGDDSRLQPVTFRPPAIKPPFYTSSENFALACHYHPCLAGRLAVTAAGDIIPCIFARSQICGSILKHSLAEVLSAAPLQQCWHTTKDSVEKCRDCEYRYACFDCRPLAQNSHPSRQWTAPPDCPYNPYTGQWPAID